MRRRSVIVDTSVLIAFEQLERLEILPELFDVIMVPPAVVREFGGCPDWARVQNVGESARVSVHRARFLDAGEAEAIALALEHEEATLLLDERRARRFAQSLGLAVVGTAGVLIRAKQTGLISEVRPLPDILRRSGFRLSDAVYARALILAGEASV